MDEGARQAVKPEWESRPSCRKTVTEVKGGPQLCWQNGEKMGFKNS